MCLSNSQHDIEMMTACCEFDRHIEMMTACCDFTPPKRRAWKAEPTVPNAFSKHFSKVVSTRFGLRIVENASKRIRNGWFGLPTSSFGEHRFRKTHRHAASCDFDRHLVSSTDTSTRYPHDGPHLVSSTDGASDTSALLSPHFVSSTDTGTDEMCTRRRTTHRVSHALLASLWSSDCISTSTLSTGDGADVRGCKNSRFVGRLGLSRFAVVDSMDRTHSSINDGAGRRAPLGLIRAFAGR